RGADSVAELNRQRERASIVICTLNADVYGLMELENTASATINDLLGAVNARCGGANPYAFVNTGGTLGTDAIRVELIYRTGILSPVGAALVDLDPVHNRPPTAQTFDVVNAANPAFGQRFTVVANHFKSKGCPGTGADADAGDGAGCFNGMRTSQATRLLTWINGTVLPAAGDPDVLLLGDFNSYAQESPVTTLASGGFTDLETALLGASAYSYLFDGQIGHLDYAFASSSLLSKITGVGAWHINADEVALFDYNDEIKDTGEATFEEKPDGSALVPPRVVFQTASPYRASDHDPVIVGLFQVADLVIAKTDTSDPVTAGTNLTYTIAVTNNGPDAASTTSWNDTLPAGTTFVSLPAVAGWSCTTPAVGAGGTISCSNPSFALGSAVFSLTVAVAPSVAAGTVISNTATVTSTAAEGNPGNESSTATTTVAASADLSVTKLDTPDPVTAGNNLTYTITVNNAGPSNAASVSLSDTLPAGTTFVSLSSPGGWTCITPAVNASGTISCSVATVAPGSAVFTLTVKVGLGVANATVLSNTATVSAVTSDPNPGNESGTATTIVNGIACPASFTVNDLGDAADATPGNGICATSGAVCTLRAAIQEANALTGCSPFVITITVTGTINLATALPALNHPNLTINGPGANMLDVHRNVAAAFRIFTINSGKTVAISGLTISNGNDPVQAGGIYNAGTLTLTACAISGNTSPQGGGIQSDNILTMTSCTVSNNIASNFAGGLKIFGPTTTLTNCTFSNNQAPDSSAIETHTGVTLTLTNCTIANNQAGSGSGQTGGALFANSGTVLKNTIVANNSGNNANIAGTVDTTNSFNNLIGAVGTGGLTNGVNGNQVGIANANTLLAALGNYGGTTNTIALLPGSPAINAGTASGAPANDQRGVARVGAVDIGAFESRGFTLALAGGNNQSAFVNTAFVNPLSITVTSAFSEPVNGGKVTFTPPGSGASASIAGNPVTISGGTASGIATANGTVGGPYNVAATANGASPTINFSLTNTNPSPTIVAAAALTRQQGTAASNSTIATVSDADQSAGTLSVTVTSANPSNGVTVSNIVNTNGTVTADVEAICGAAAAASFTLTVTDSGNSATNGTLNVTVNPNTVPVLTYANQSVTAGGAIMFNPATGPTDNGSISTIAVQSQGSYTGTINVNSAGMVTVSGATPSGTHTIIIRATDNCGMTTDASFTLTVNCQGGLTVNPASLANGFQGTAYNQTLTASGGAAAYTFATTAGNLPGGLTLSAAGVLSGTPTANGTFNFTVTATDANGCTGMRAYTVIISGSGLMFYPLATPVRLLDTRGPSLSPNACTFNGSQPIASNTSLLQAARGICGIPATAQAITGNVTTVNSGGGYLTLYPSGAVRPTVASINYNPNEIVNNV
ncbi:MAG: putative Ig domain-containing protein, partial [Acidobacteriota bacterium]|nr:putative Ig domain-containing protein [Acidobacteriota bacterium]